MEGLRQRMIARLTETTTSPRRPRGQWRPANTQKQSVPGPEQSTGGSGRNPAPSVVYSARVSEQRFQLFHFQESATHYLPATLRSDHPLKPLLLKGHHRTSNIRAHWLLDIEITNPAVAAQRKHRPRANGAPQGRQTAADFLHRVRFGQHTAAKTRNPIGSPSGAIAA